MSRYDATSLPEGALAHQFTLCDHFFHAAFGSSFLNHQFLIAAQAPIYPEPPAELVAAVDEHGKLTLDNRGKVMREGIVIPRGSRTYGSQSKLFDHHYAVNDLASGELATCQCASIVFVTVAFAK